ncbi:CAP domain-containing protein [Actinomadura sp. 9N407]|uniref:CAP domain-containing protein n=1 Tax=Actinomadura sp. 9N407 TaxID=3375154 RepID=UPI00378847E3
MNRYDKRPGDTFGEERHGRRSGARPPQGARPQSARPKGGRGSSARWAVAASAAAVVSIAVAGTGYALAGSAEKSPRSPAGAADRAEQPAPAPAPATTTPERPAKSTTPTPKPKQKKARESASTKPSRATPSKSRSPARSPRRAAPVDASTAGQVVSLTNAERAKHGCRPLTLDGRLQNAAQRHSADMAARGFFSHTSPEGKSPGDRITAAGYRWSTYGENIAAGQPTPSSVVSAWMKSPGHRANILNCSFRHIGIGLARKGGTPNWTQVFGAR